MAAAFLDKEKGAVEPRQVSVQSEVDAVSFGDPLLTLQDGADLSEDRLACILSQRPIRQQGCGFGQNADAHGVAIIVAGIEGLDRLRKMFQFIALHLQFVAVALEVKRAAGQGGTRLVTDIIIAFKVIQIDGRGQGKQVKHIDLVFAESDRAEVCLRG